jgi:hypothetical protein
VGVRFCVAAVLISTHMWFSVSSKKRISRSISFLASLRSLPIARKISAGFASAAMSSQSRPAVACVQTCLGVTCYARCQLGSCGYASFMVRVRAGAEAANFPSACFHGIMIT